MARPKKIIKKQYQVKFPRQKDFPINEIIDWLKIIAVGGWHYTNRKNDIIYEFEYLDDAFKFRMDFSEYIG